MTFYLSGLLLRFTDYQQEIPIQSERLDHAVDELVRLHPRLAPVLRTSDARVRKAHRLFLNGEAVVSETLDIPLGHDDQVEILTAIAGG